MISWVCTELVDYIVKIWENSGYGSLDYSC